jgi:hypothetical protein
MRRLAAALVALAIASPAAAEISPAQISFSPEFETALREELGEDEGDYLRETTSAAINRAIARRNVRGAGPAIEVVIVDADPNHPTMHQMTETPGLSMQSISLGGAELRAVLRGADGAVVEEVSHRRYNHTLEEIGAATTWGEARRAIRRFADKVADAYAAHAQ